MPATVKGAAIANVRPGSPADDAGLAPGDVILEVNRKPVEDAQSCVNAIHAAPDGKDVLLLVWANGGTTTGWCIRRMENRAECKSFLLCKFLYRLRASAGDFSPVEARVFWIACGSGARRLQIYPAL